MTPGLTARLPAALAAGLLALGCAAAAQAQDQVQVHPMAPGADGMPAPAAGIVRVWGEGQSMVAPDLATVSVGVTTQAPTAAQAMADNSARQARVIEAARGLGIAAEDMQTQALNLSPVQDYSRENQPPVVRGYQAQNIVSVRVHDIAKLGGLLDALIGAGATDVQGVAFSREDDAAARDAARTEAVVDARRRAEVMARAAGRQLGPLLSLSENGDQGGPVPVMMMARDAKAGSAPVEAGQMSLAARVDAVWALAPATGAEGAPAAPAAPATAATPVPGAPPAAPAAPAGQN
ncbi:hypothetical protein B0A89_10050 [Paracoccus contaminans]|uniref:SIMPL domain-containing protein n=2 Tax=Paracoccus contaminans TaxID=1945662 RepID=A0A1W6CYI8_9RHOB|nr:hypothetical protein B0A89_10050 [Paracoccus contaminans]